MSDPIKTADGYQILRLDERTAAGDAPVFNDSQVRGAMLGERAPKERDAYLETLRNEAFIKVTDPYREGVEPLLKLKAPAAAKSSEKDKKEKKP